MSTRHTLQHATNTYFYPMAPQMPAVAASHLALMSLDEAFAAEPELIEAMRMNETCQVHQNTKADMLAVAKKGILVVWLPPEFEPMLPKVAAIKPEAVNYTTLDLEDIETYAVWGFTSDDGQWYEISVPIEAWDYALVNAADSTHQSTRVAFLARERAALVDITWDEADLAGAQGACICSQSYIQYSNEELSSACAKAEALGTIRPWINTVWDDGEGAKRASLLAYRFW